VKLQGGGYETWEIVYGTTLAVSPSVLWSASGAKLKDVFATLQAMQEAIQEKGFGGTVEIWAGKTAYETLFGLAEASVTTAKIRVEITEQGINVGGFLVRRRAERYRNPQTEAMVAVLGDKVVRMIATDAGHKLPYCALDDLDANLQPLPFFVKPIQQKDPSGWKLIAESKPFPIPNCSGICDATVVS
jgi:nucleoid DNA-binding protein